MLHLSFILEFLLGLCQTPLRSRSCMLSLSTCSGHWAALAGWFMVMRHVWILINTAQLVAGTDTPSVSAPLVAGSITFFHQKAVTWHTFWEVWPLPWQDSASTSGFPWKVFTCARLGLEDSPAPSSFLSWYCFLLTQEPFTYNLPQVGHIVWIQLDTCRIYLPQRQLQFSYALILLRNTVICVFNIMFL